MDSLPKTEYAKPENFTPQVAQIPLKINHNGLSTLEIPISTSQANDEIDSKSSESSFITDSSPSESEDEVGKRSKKQNVAANGFGQRSDEFLSDIRDIYHKQEDLANFQAGIFDFND